MNFRSPSCSSQFLFSLGFISQAMFWLRFQNISIMGEMLWNIFWRGWSWGNHQSLREILWSAPPPRPQCATVRPHLFFILFPVNRIRMIFVFNIKKNAATPFLFFYLNYISTRPGENTGCFLTVPSAKRKNGFQLTRTFCTLRISWDKISDWKLGGTVKKNTLYIYTYLLPKIDHFCIYKGFFIKSPVLI